MAKQKNDRSELREQRLKEEADAAAAERRQRLTKLGALAVFAAIVIVAIAVVASQSGSDSSSSAGGGGNNGGSGTTNALLAGIPQKGTILGDPSAKTTIIEFGDLQCPICQEYSQTIVPEVIRGPVRSGDAKIEFRNWIIIGPQSVPAAKAALAASLQNRYWQFIEDFYAHQGTENSGYVTDSFLQSIAKDAGVPDLSKWNSDRKSSRWNSVLTATNRQAQAFGFSGTPSFAIAGPNGTKPIGTPQSASAITDEVAKGGG